MRKPVVIYSLSQIIVLLIFYWPMVVGQQTFYWQDHTYFFEPLCSFIGRAFASGHAPLWNPYAYCGMPEIAVSSPSIFYPLNWLFAILPYSNALALIMIVSQTICGLGGFLLVSYFGWGLLPAVLCGTVLALNGYMFSLSSNYTLVATASWLPLSMWLTFKISNIKSGNLVFATIGLAACIFMLITAGRPEIGIPALIILALLDIYIFFRGSRKRRRERLMAHVTAMILGVLAAMPVILPILEWLPLSRRAQGLNVNESLMFSANWYDMLNLFASQTLGDMQTNSKDMTELFGQVYMGEYYASAFLGSIVLMLAVLGITRKGKQLYTLSMAALVATVIFSLGSNVPLTDALLKLFRPLSTLRFPCKYLFFTVMLIAFFAARGLSQYLDGKTKLQTPVILMGALSLIGLLLWIAPYTVLPFAPMPSIDNEHLASTAQHIIGQGLTFWSLLALLAALILHFSQNRSRKRAAIAVAALATFGLLYHAFARCHSCAAADFYQTPSIAARLLKTVAHDDHRLSEHFRYIHLDFDKTSAPSAYSDPNELTADIKSYQYSRQLLVEFTNMDFDIPSAWGFEGSLLWNYYSLLVKSHYRSSQYLKSPGTATTVAPEALARTDLPIKTVLQVAAIPYVITQEYKSVPSQPEPLDVPVLDPRYFDLVFQRAEFNARMYKVKDSLPRAYLSFNWKPFKYYGNLLGQIYYADKSKFDPSTMTLLDPGCTDSLPAPGRSPTLRYIPLKVEQPYPEHLTIDADAPASSILVLADQYYPGWVAEVDGHGTPIFRCNGFTRAVQVPPGRHRIAFDYKPKSLYYGFLLAGLGLVWALILVARSYTRKRIKRPVPD